MYQAEGERARQLSEEALAVRSKMTKYERRINTFKDRITKDTERIEDFKGGIASAESTVSVLNNLQPFGRGC